MRLFYVIFLSMLSLPNLLLAQKTILFEEHFDTFKKGTVDDPWHISINVDETNEIQAGLLNSDQWYGQTLFQAGGAIALDPYFEPAIGGMVPGYLGIPATNYASSAEKVTLSVLARAPKGKGNLICVDHYRRTSRGDVHLEFFLLFREVSQVEDPTVDDTWRTFVAKDIAVTDSSFFEFAPYDDYLLLDDILVYAEDVSAVETPKPSADYVATVQGNQLQLTLETPVEVRVYTDQGKCLYQNVSGTLEQFIPLASDQVYLLQVGETVQKIVTTH